MLILMILLAGAITLVSALSFLIKFEGGLTCQPIGQSLGTSSLPLLRHIFLLSLTIYERRVGKYIRQWAFPCFPSMRLALCTPFLFTEPTCTPSFLHYPDIT
ncbi:hypothetical protein ARMGADRAFT_558142 [Armillaria gallica]|uniref:Uncharacterized protein n=1 Tax=Armillaria gallica TaxID=47427 RepID=A0A2H3DDF5_ARMGA|nr:hypothetical protein ARMGADRAFT_558142 [Armillaria gallica]